MFALNPAGGICSVRRDADTDPRDAKSTSELGKDAGGPRKQRWFRNFEKGVKWKLGLTAGMFCLRIRSENEEASPPEPHTGLQGEGGPCCPEKRSNDCTAC